MTESILYDLEIMLMRGSTYDKMVLVVGTTIAIFMTIHIVILAIDHGPGLYANRRKIIEFSKRGSEYTRIALRVPFVPELLVLGLIVQHLAGLSYIRSYQDKVNFKVGQMRDACFCPENDYYGIVNVLAIISPDDSSAMAPTVSAAFEREHPLVIASRELVTHRE